MRDRRNSIRIGKRTFPKTEPECIFVSPEVEDLWFESQTNWPPSGLHSTSGTRTSET